MKEEQEVQDIYGVTYGDKSIVFRPNVQRGGKKVSLAILYMGLDQEGSEVFEVADDSVEEFKNLFKGVFEEFSNIFSEVSKEEENADK